MHMLAISPPSGWELMLILGIFVLLFGARKLPELAGSVGKSITSFKRGVDDAKAEDAEADGTTFTDDPTSPQSGDPTAPQSGDPTGPREG